MKGVYSSQKSERSYIWYGTNAYEEAVKLLREGYVEILPRVKSEYKKNVNILSEKFSISKSRPIDSFCGGIPNVPNTLLGLPKTMLNRDPIVRRIKTIDIIYSPTGPYRVKPKRFIEAGIALLSAIELIERSRIQIRLISCFASSHIQGEAIIGTVVIKEYSDRLDIQKLCFPLAHPSMLRRIGFKFTETVPGMTKDFTDGYGMAMDYSQFCSLYKRKPQTVLLTLDLIIQFCHAYRKAVKDSGVNSIFSYRGLSNITSMKEDLPLEDLMRSCLTKGMTKDDLVIIKESISMDDSENPYLKAFTNL